MLCVCEFSRPPQLKGRWIWDSNSLEHWVQVRRNLEAESLAPEGHLPRWCCEREHGMSTTGGIPMLLPPLAGILALIAIKDLIEDNRRKVSDADENNRTIST